MACSANLFALDCQNAPTTLAMNACLQTQLEQADQRLNVLYKQLRQRLDDTGKTLLRDAQRAWIEYRDAECLWAADEARGGTLAGVLHSACLAEQTRLRGDDLQAYLDSAR